MGLSSCNVTWKDYLKLLINLLPPGYAWDWRETSVGRHLLAVFADELVRFHVFMCELGNNAIDDFKTEQYGWSAPEYEQLLKDKFQITAKVSDWQMTTPHVDNAHCESALWDERFKYFVIITVPDVADIPQAVKDYLKEYKQSHTAICWRSHPTWQEKWDIQATTTDNATCESPIYEQDFHAIEITQHPSFAFEELMQYVELTNTKAHTRYYTNLEPLCTL